jgi:hypothetical protein
MIKLTGTLRKEVGHGICKGGEILSAIAALYQTFREYIIMPQSLSNVQIVLEILGSLGSVLGVQIKPRMKPLTAVDVRIDYQVEGHLLQARFISDRGMLVKNGRSLEVGASDFKEKVIHSFRIDEVIGLY